MERITIKLKKTKGGNHTIEFFASKGLSKGEIVGLLEIAKDTFIKEKINNEIK